LLVTGGCGYLGRELVRRGAERGWRVRATWFRRPPAGEAEWVRADVRDPVAVHAAAVGVDAVIHTAVDHGGEWTTNVDAAAVVAGAARHARLVHLSSDVVFDGTRGRYRETDDPKPVNVYGRSKLEAEQRVAAVHPAATLARTSLLYGGAEPGRQERLAREGTRFFVDEIRSPVHVGDLASALLDLLELDAPGALHVAGGDDVSRFDLALLLGAARERIEAAQTSADRAPNVSLDSSRAARLLRTRLRGVYEVVGSGSSGATRSISANNDSA
jgi:dTDP-4-dehydrorhamnose reductase